MNKEWPGNCRWITRTRKWEMAREKAKDKAKARPVRAQSAIAKEFGCKPRATNFGCKAKEMDGEVTREDIKPNVG